VCKPTEGRPRIALDDAFLVRNAVDVDDADDRAGQIEVARFVEARHFGRLTAEQRHAVRAARLRHAAHDVGSHCRFELSDSEVVEKKERRRGNDQDIVDAVVYQVAADAVIPAHLRRDEDFRADPVGRRDERARAVAR
jgi:hypothetical protein